MRQLLAAVAEFCIGAKTVGHLVILRTTPGAAQHLAALIDGMKLDSLVGSIAGDDTILLITSPPDLTPTDSAVTLLHTLGIAGHG